MARIETSIEISAAPMTVFRFCHDLDRRAEWDERVIGAKLITPPPLRRGSIVRIEAGRNDRFLFTWDAEYDIYQIPSNSALKVIDAAPSAPFKAGTETWRFDQSGSGTQFTWVWEYQPRGIIARIMDFFRRPGIKRGIQHSLENVKRLIEKR